MPTSLIRGRSIFTHALDRNHWHRVDDGAILQRDGVIAEIAGFADLQRRHPDVAVVGDGSDVILPGFVNAHHHVGLTAVQLGAPDLPLELWFVARMLIRDVDPYLDTLYSAFEMIASGITTVQHVHGWVRGSADAIGARADAILRAYDDVGMRVSYCYGVRDQNRLVYQHDDAFAASLPEPLRPAMQHWFGQFQADLDDSMGLFHDLYISHNGKPRTRIQLSPANLQWCSDRALTQLSDASSKLGVPLHAHLLETRFQVEYASRRGACTAVDYLDRFGMVTPRLTIGHGVWLSERDMDRMASAGACICHNCSSNMRLRSGLAPLNAFEAKGITTAIGLDDAGINDDRDMLQEMRLVLRAHRHPGLDAADVPTPAQVLRMATAGGARTTPFGSDIGTLEVGKAADLVMIDGAHVAYPYLDEETPLLDAVIQRAKSAGVTMTICAGEPIYHRGRFLRVDRDKALAELHARLQKDLTPAELERRHLSKAIMPYVRTFYEAYVPTGRSS